MIVNAEDLNGAALDWMIAKFMKNELLMDGIREGLSGAVSPSTDWSVGGPIIESEKMVVGYRSDNREWFAEHVSLRKDMTQTGETPLIAAMRSCIVANFGPRVEVPDEIMSLSNSRLKGVRL